MGIKEYAVDSFVRIILSNSNPSESPPA